MIKVSYARIEKNGIIILIDMFPSIKLFEERDAFGNLEGLKNDGCLVDSLNYFYNLFDSWLVCLLFAVTVYVPSGA